MISYRQADLRDKISKEYVDHRVLLLDGGFTNDPVIDQHGSKLTFPDRTIDLNHFTIVGDTAPTQFPILYICSKEDGPHLYRWKLYKNNLAAPENHGHIINIYANATLETTRGTIVDLNKDFLHFVNKDQAIYITHR